MPFRSRVVLSPLAESVFATLPYTQRATAMVLNGDPKGKNFLYCNGNTVVIRDVAVSQGCLLTTPSSPPFFLDSCSCISLFFVAPRSPLFPPTS